MCLAIYKPGGARIKHEKLRNGWDSNNHGAGFCYPNEDKSELIIKKGFMTFDAFIEAYKPVAAEPLLIHFRWATHGARDEFNCHPWPIVGPDGKVWFAVIHNGVISKVASNRDISDTGAFVDKFLKPILLNSRVGLPEVWTPIKALLEEYVGYGNKLAIMTRDGSYTILNENAGHWENKCWWSNYCYRTVKTRETYTPPATATSSASIAPSREFSASDVAINKDTICFHIKAAVGSVMADKIKARAEQWMELAVPIDMAFIYAMTEIAPEDFGVPDNEREVPKMPEKKPEVTQPTAQNTEPVQPS